MKDHNNRIEILGLPHFVDLEQLSRQIHLSRLFLARLFQFSNNYYKAYEIAKKSGGRRLIAQPSKNMKAVQAWILREILDKLKSHPASMGFESGKSILDNALPHAGAKKLITIDIEDFFGAITKKQVEIVFKDLGYNGWVSDYLSEVCTFNDSLPQGGCTSPKLANLVCRGMDEKIQSITKNLGIIYTRYADDISLSSPFDHKITHIIKTVEKIINDEGFRINRKKLRVKGPSKKKMVTGLVIDGHKVGIGREKYRLIRAKINHLCKDNQRDHREINHVQGWLSFIYSVDKERYERLKGYVEKLKRKYPQSSLQRIRLID